MDRGCNTTNAQDELSKNAQRFSSYTGKAHTKRAVKHASAFIERCEDRYDVDGGLSQGEPFLTDAELARLKDESQSRFSMAGNRRIAVLRVFSNGLAAAMQDLIASGYVAKETWAKHHEMVFDEKTLDFLDFLQRRREAASRPGAPASDVTLSDAVLAFTGSRCKTTRTRVRDTILVPLAQFGLLTGRYDVGSGYALRAGPVLSATVTQAVEPFLVTHNL